MSKGLAVRLSRTGGPEVLEVATVEVGEPGPGQARVRQLAVGVNFIDIYHRTGLYPLSLPSGLGQEASGVVEAVGPGVEGLTAGDKVAYAGGPPGAYSQLRLVAADRLVPLPDEIGFEQAASMMLKGLTVQYLIRRTFRVQPKDTVLLQAAAGGVGLIACQWLRQLGATVIGTVGSEEKAALARAHGAHHTIIYTRQDVVAQVRALTSGAGVKVVYDGVGKDTFFSSLDCLCPRGMMVSFGNASGPVPPFDPLALTSRGSLFFTRPSLAHYTASRKELLEASAELFEVVKTGKVKVGPSATFSLSQAALAHQGLEARKTTGSLVLLP